MEKAEIETIVKDYIKNHLKVDAYFYDGHVEVTLMLDNETGAYKETK